MSHIANKSHALLHIYSALGQLCDSVYAYDYAFSSCAPLDLWRKMQSDVAITSINARLNAIADYLCSVSFEPLTDPIEVNVPNVPTRATDTDYPYFLIASIKSLYKSIGSSSYNRAIREVAKLRYVWRLAQHAGKVNANVKSSTTESPC